MAEDAEGAWGVAEAFSDFGRRDPFDEVGAESFVLTVRRGLRFEEEPSLIC
jgi:hypothetical protein